MSWLETSQARPSVSRTAGQRVFASVEVQAERRADGTMIVTNRIPLGNYPANLLHRLDHWASERPSQTYLGQRASEGRRTLSYAATRAAVDELAARLTADQIAHHPALIAVIRSHLRAHHHRQTGSSTRIERFRLTSTPPNRLANEITDKGSLNQRAVLEARADEVDALYADGGCTVLVPDPAWRRQR